MTLALSLQPVVTARDVRFGNADWAATAQMASADYLLIQIDIPALFDRHLHLLDLQLRQLVLNLEDQVTGQPNWQFSEGADQGEPWTFMIQSLDLAHAEITAKIGELEPIEITIPQFTLASDASGHLQITGHGTLNDGQSHVSGRIGPFEELLGAGRIELDLDLKVEDTELGVRGSIGNLATLSGLNLELTAHGPDADGIGEIFGMPDAFAGDVALQATIHPDNPGHAITVAGHISQFSIETSGTVLDLINLDGLDGSVSFAGPDLGVFGKTLQIAGFPDGPFQVAGGLHRHGGDLDLTDVQIKTDDLEMSLTADFAEFPSMDRAFGSLRIHGPDISQFGALLHLDSLPHQPFQLDMALSDTGPELLTSNLKVGDHQLVLAGSVGEYPDFHQSSLTASLSGGDLSALLGIFTNTLPLNGAYQANAAINLNSNGLTLSDAEVVSEDGRLSGSIHWRDPGNPREFDLEATLDLTDLAETGARFGFNELPAAPVETRAVLEARAGEIQLVESSTRFQTLDMSTAGALGNLRSTAGLDLRVEISGASVDDLFGTRRPEGEAPIAFTLSSAVRGREDSLELAGLELTAAGGRLQVDGTYRFDSGFVGSSAVIRGQGQSLARVLPNFPSYQPADNPWQIHAEISRPAPDQLSIRNGRLEIGSIDITVSGQLDTGDHADTQIRITASGDRISDFGQLGTILWPGHPFNFSADLQGTAGLITISNLESRWGDSDLTGSGSMRLSDKPKLMVHGRSQVLNVTDLQHALFGVPQESEPSGKRTRIIPDIEIPMDYLSLFDAEFDIEVAQYQGQRSRLQDVALQLNVLDGGLFLEQAAWGDSIGHFNAHGVLRPEGERVHMELVFKGDDADLGLFTTGNQARETIPRYTLDVAVTGEGRTVAELVAAMDGTILVSSDGGQINNAQLDTFAGDFLANVLKVLNPFEQSTGFTPMECLVLNAAITGGKVKLEPGFVMRTDRVNMYVYGGIDLRKESLDLSLATQARRGIGISAASITNPYFKVGGTLAAPALNLDPASAAVAASIATATGGLSIVFKGLWDRLAGAQNPCPTFENYQRKPDKSAAITPG